MKNLVLPEAAQLVRSDAYSESKNEQPTYHPFPPITMLRMPAMQTRSGFCRSSIYNKIKAGLWPKPVRLGPKVVACPEHEVSAVLAAYVAEKSEDEIRMLVAQLQAKRKAIA